MILKKIISSKLKDREFTLTDLYEAIPDKPKTTLRARIYENIGIDFERIKKGKKSIYRVIDKESQCVLIEGNGRDLSFLDDESMDCIITDHPWSDSKSNIGGDRKFTDSYSCFMYTIDDFKEKARVLKTGSFLVETLPAENENNFDYLYSLKKLAQKCGLLYYAKVSWKKGLFVSNTGRKAKNTEDLMIFSKGKARSMRIDAKKTKANNGELVYMSGTNGMLPTCFDIEAVKRNDKIHQSEKPIQLWEELLEYITLEGEWILDQYAGSGSVGVASLNKNRNSILIEVLSENISNIKNRFISIFGKNSLCQI